MRNKFKGTGAVSYRPLGKIRVIAGGLRFAALHDRSVTRKLILSGIVVLASIYFRQWVDLMVVLIVTGQALAAELFNTAIEAVCDYLETGFDERIKTVKDISAAATGVSTLIWAVVLTYECYRLLLR